MVKGSLRYLNCHQHILNRLGHLESRKSHANSSYDRDIRGPFTYCPHYLDQSRCVSKN